MRIAQTIALTSIAATAPPRLTLAAAEAVAHRLDVSANGEPAPVQLGREAHLGVDDAVGGEIDGRLVGDPFDALGRLHHRQRVLERREVLEDVLRLGAAGEPRLQLAGSVDGGGVQPLASASSRIVCGRRPPSRWSWSRHLRARPRIAVAP